MTSALVLDPGFSFADLEQRLSQGGWLLVGTADKPILPGEPEHAVFERGTDRIFYSFNPVCRLRVLDRSAMADASSLPALPAVAAATIRRWLASDDERTLLLGILAAGQLADVELADPVEAHRTHPRASIAAAAARAGQALRAGAEAPASDAERHAQDQSLGAIEILRQQLTPLLRALAEDADGSLSAALRPRPEDFARAFQPQAVETAREAYDALWVEKPARVSRAAPGSQLEINIAPAGMLTGDNVLSWKFPGGYRGIAPLLNPHRTWVAWKVIAPGKTSGMAYDGLVWLDDHWAWFPKPYRVLADLAR